MQSVASFIREKEEEVAQLSSMRLSTMEAVASEKVLVVLDSFERCCMRRLLQMTFAHKGFGVVQEHAAALGRSRYQKLREDFKYNLSVWFLMH